MQVTSKQYWDEIARLASDPELQDWDDLVECVDQHEYILYTAKALCVLMHTKNDNAVFDDGFSMEGCQDASSVYVRMAFYAMLADVLEYRAS